MILDHTIAMSYILTLKAPVIKHYLKLTSALVVCCLYLLTLLINEGIIANSVNQDQTPPIEAVRSGSTLVDRDTSKISADNFCCDWRF